MALTVRTIHLSAHAWTVTSMSIHLIAQNVHISALSATIMPATASLARETTETIILLNAAVLMATMTMVITPIVLLARTDAPPASERNKIAHFVLTEPTDSRLILNVLASPATMTMEFSPTV